jgi:two-component system, LytTR family, response regulator
MLTTVLIDDESRSLKVLESLIHDFTSIPIKVVGKAQNLNDGIKCIKKSNPDIVFLDIDMPDAIGMDIYKHFHNPKFKIIFVTAYKEYAIEALKHSATDYILKPVNFVELRESILKASNEIEIEQKHKELEDKLSQLSATDMDGENVMIDTDNGFVVENTRNIEYCIADTAYSKIVTHLGKQIIVTKPLKQLEEMLPTDQFYRTHKSYLVNIYYIRNYVRGDESYVLVRSGQKIPVSVRKSSVIAKEIKDMLSK